MQISHITNHANVFDYYQKPETSGKFLGMNAFPIPTIYFIA